MKRTREILMEQMERIAELAEHTEDVIAGYKMQIELAEAMTKLADRVLACDSFHFDAALKTGLTGQARQYV